MVLEEPVLPTKICCEPNKKKISQDPMISPQANLSSNLSLNIFDYLTAGGLNFTKFLK